MTYEEITRFQAALRVAVISLAKDHGMDAVDVGRMQVRGDQMQVTVTGLPHETGAEEFARSAAVRGFDSALYGAEFRHGRTNFKVVGIRPLADKNCFLIRPVSGAGTRDKVCGAEFLESKGLRVRAAT